MIHLYGQEQSTDYAITEINILQECGVDGFIVENYHGNISDVKKTLSEIDGLYDNMYKGINILPNDFKTAYELASLHKLDFIQLDYVSGSYDNVTDFDFESFLLFRDKYPNIKILGGVWPKYYTPKFDSNLEDDILNATKLCDSIVVTGSGTGKETPLDKIKKFKLLSGDTPTIIGAGLNTSNVSEQLFYADGAIVGSCFKMYGRTTNSISKVLVNEFMKEVNKLR